MAAYTTVDDPELYFQTKTYSGSSSDISATFDGTNDMQPDWVWLKQRGGSGDHLVYDSVRGVNKRLTLNGTDAEVDRSANNDELKSFDSDGWTLGTFNSNVTGAGSTNVSWNWKANGSGSSNTDGTINTTKTSANTTAGFSINTFEGTGAIATVGHGLGAAPTVLILKKTSQGANWGIGSVHIDNWTDYLTFTTGANSDDANFWNDAAPTSTVFSIGSSGNINTDGEDHVAYCFTPIQGFSKFGLYHGNGNVDGTFIHLGFRPAWFMIKRTNATEQWEVVDNKRSVNNPVNDVLVPNGDAAEIAAATGNRIYCDFCSNGVKLRGNASSANESGGIFFYMAFAEQPFVNSNGVPNNAR